MHSKSVHIILAVTFDCVLDSLLKLVVRLHFFLILVTAIGSRPKPELCFLLGRLRWTLLPRSTTVIQLVTVDRTPNLRGDFTTELLSPLHFPCWSLNHYYRLFRSLYIHPKQHRHREVCFKLIFCKNFFNALFFAPNDCWLCLHKLGVYLRIWWTRWIIFDTCRPS